MSDLTIATFNCCLSVCPPLRYNGAFSRAARLADSLYSCVSHETLDIICFQELIVQRDSVLKGLIHHPNHTAPVSSSLFGDNIRFVHSGLAIATKWEILEQDAFVFTGESYQAEMLMAKALLYVKVAMHGGKQVVHVFNTHMQAWTTPLACRVRDEQAKQIAQFMQMKIGNNIHSNNELVVFCADANIDDYESRSMVDKIMSVVRCQFLRPVQPEFSFDPTSNPLVGSDDFREYQTRSKQNGCYDEFLATGISSCSPRQLIDLVAIHDESKHHLESFETHVVPILSQHEFEIHIDARHKRSVRTVSDHYAVVTRMRLAPSCVTLVAPNYVHPRYRNKYRKKCHFGWVMFELLVFFMFFLLFLLVFRAIGKRVFR